MREARVNVKVCGLIVSSPPGCVPIREAMDVLKAPRYALSHYATPGRIVTHRTSSGAAHCHRVSYVPISALDFLLRIADYGISPYAPDRRGVPAALITAARRKRDIASRLLVLWSTERNTRLLARSFTHHGAKQQAMAHRLYEQARTLRRMRDETVRMMVRAAIQAAPPRWRWLRAGPSRAYIDDINRADRADRANRADRVNLS